MCDDPDDQAIDLTIEALTGTVYDLCVSPFETILGIKMKIQRLEGIPVYQQQLVYAGLELQDEFCLEEYSIPSGAQLKLLIAMRGGPIHAHRVHLEDPTLLEIAELLDAEGPNQKYTVMLVSRDGDAVDVADFVQMYNEDSYESVSCSPVQVSESHQNVGVSASKATQTEHALTRDKMRELMAKLKRLRPHRHLPPVGTRSSGAQLQHQGTAKVLILDSRASSRLLQPSSGPSPLPTQYSSEAARMPAQRKLVFPPSEERWRRREKRQPLLKRTHSPEEEPRTHSRKHLTRLRDTVCSGATPHHHPPHAHPPHHPREWRKAAKRPRRNSIVDDRRNLDVLRMRDSVGELADQVSQLQVSQLALESRGGGAGETGVQSKCSLPKIPSPHTLRPATLTYNTGKSRTRTSSERLPQLATSRTALATATAMTHKRRDRCLKCGRKMGLASTYTCRCGGMFCAIHRYAETHSCTFDYKAEGRQMIARNNPVVTAPKLPKI